MLSILFTHGSSLKQFGSSTKILKTHNRASFVHVKSIRQQVYVWTHAQLPLKSLTVNFMIQIAYKEMGQCYRGVINIDFLLLFFLYSLKVLGLLLSSMSYRVSH